MRFGVTSPSREEFAAALLPITEHYGMTWRLDVVGRPLRTLVLASTAAHCVNDLLFRQRAGQLAVDIPMILSNHGSLRDLAEFYGVPFESRPVVSPESKRGFEERVLEVVEEHDVELVVLARYMQILSDGLCRELRGRAINIHHSMLPSFKGARPYHQAHDRGVKFIGATAHYVTADLDEGPIIEQEMLRVDHSLGPEQLAARGREAETRALARAVRWHTENRIVIHGSRTVVFE